MNDTPMADPIGKVIREAVRKKPPRKPRPSEIAAKKAKAAAKKKKAAKRPKAKRSSKPKSRKPAKRKATNRRPAQRTERLDMRVTKEARRLLEAKAKKTDSTVTNVAWRAISIGLKKIK